MICTNNLKKLNWYVLFVLTPYEDSLCSYLNQRYGADAFMESGYYLYWKPFRSDAV